MAKRTRQMANDIPTPDPVEVRPVAQTIEVQQTEIVCRVPFVSGLNGYCRRRVDLSLTSDQARTLKGILQGLEAADATLANGRLVSNPGHAIAWVLEQMLVDTDS